MKFKNKTLVAAAATALLSSNAMALVQFSNVEKLQEDKTYTQSVRVNEGGSLLGENISVIVDSAESAKYFRSESNTTVNLGSLSVNGHVENYKDANLSLGTLILKSTFTNAGTASIGKVSGEGASITNQGSLSLGSADVTGGITNHSAAILTITGNIATEGQLQNGGTLYLQSDNVLIDAPTVNFLADGTVKKSENEESLGNLTITGYLGLSSDLNVSGDLSVNRANISSNLVVAGTFTHNDDDTYTIFRPESNSKIEKFAAPNGKYGFNVLDSSLTVGTVETVGANKVADAGKLSITNSASMGSLYNSGDVYAPDAAVTITGNSILLEEYALTNGMDDKGVKSAASMTVGSLIVEGDVYNAAGGTDTQMQVENLQVSGTFTNESMLKVQGGQAVLGSIQKGEQGAGRIELSNASLQLGGSSSMGDVSASKSRLRFASGNYDLNSLTSDASTFEIEDVKGTKITSQSKTGTVGLQTSGSENDKFASAGEAMTALQNVLTVDGMAAADTLTLEQGAVNDGIVANRNEQGGYDQIVYKNTKLDALGSISVLGVVNLRHEMNSLTKRMGELRDSPEGIGTWVRLYGSENEYGNQNVTARNTTIQVGSDVSLGNWKVGAALSYTDGDSSYDAGEGDNKTYGFALYGTWLSESGQFVDLIAKYSRLDQDFSLEGMDGSFDNNAFSLSAEYGWRFEVGSLGFVEPQAEFTYYRVQGDDFTTSNSVKVEQDDYDSYIGRVGVRGGLKFPNNKGVIYARVSYLYDFDGEMHADVRSMTSASRNSIDEDMGGSWVEYGVGANFNWTDSTYTYVDLERNSGGEVKENWSWNIGLRHVF